VLEARRAVGPRDAALRAAVTAPKYRRVDTGGGSSFPPAYSERDDYLDLLCVALTMGEADRSQQCAARSYIEAYCALVDATRDRRAEVVRALRRDAGRKP